MAILLVVVAHANVISAPVGGMVGVTLFFVLSGFLITNLLMEEMDRSGSLDLRSFYARRALRLLPALAFYLIGISLALKVLAVDVPVVETLWAPTLYSSNYAQILGVDLYAHRHTWSLAVEEHFYLVWPLLVLLGATRRVRLLALAVAGLVAWRLLVGNLDPLWGYMGTDTNAFALGAGALLASARREGRLFAPGPRVATFGVGGLALLSFVQADGAQGLYATSTWVTIVAAALAVTVVWAAVETGHSGFLSAKPLRWFGLISYSLYLWHAPLVQFPGLGETPMSRLTAVGIGVAVAWASWHLLEGPIMRSRLRMRLKSGVATSPSFSTVRAATVVVEEVS